MAMDDIGLALPREFSACFRCRRISPPALSTTGPLTNQAYMSKLEAHGEGEAYPRYPPLARPNDVEKREQGRPFPGSGCRRPDPVHGAERPIAGGGMDEALPLAPKIVKLIPSRERVSGAFHLRRFRG